MIQFILFSIYAIGVLVLMLREIVPGVIEERECPCKIKVPTLMYSFLVFFSGVFILNYPPFVISDPQQLFLGIMAYFTVSGIVYKFNSVVGDTLYAVAGFLLPVAVVYLYPIILAKMLFLYVLSILSGVMTFSLFKLKKRYFPFLTGMWLLMICSVAFSNPFIILSFFLISAPKISTVLADTILREEKVIDMLYLSSILQSVGFLIMSLTMLFM